MTPEPLDTTIRIVTPENIAFDHRLAGPFRRLPAYALDLLILFAIGAGTLFLTELLIPSSARVGVALVVGFFLFWGYGGLCETFFNGQTLGKRALGIRVVSTRGLPINGWQAVLRNVLRAVDFAMFFLMATALSFLFTRRFQRLGDLAADTMVVVEEGRRFRAVRAVPAEGLEALEARIPASFVVDRRLADALAAYAARRGLLTAPRRREIAMHLARPLAERFGIDGDVDPDRLVCALYRREFHA